MEFCEISEGFGKVVKFDRASYELGEFFLFVANVG